MKETLTFHLKAPPKRVWAVLSDLSGYASWHPLYRFGNGLVTPGAVISLSWLISGDFRINTDIEVVHYDEGAAISWKTGLPRTLQIEECFEIIDEGAGTFVYHSIEYRGWVSALIWRFMKRRLRHRLSIESGIFARTVEGNQRIHAAGNRHKRRSLKAQAGHRANDE